MKPPSLRERLRYSFDNFMARGTIALIAGLGVVAAVGILAVTLVLGILGYADGGFVNGGTTMSDLLWNSLMRTLDPGTMGGDSAPFGFLLGMLAVTLLRDLRRSARSSASSTPVSKGSWRACARVAPVSSSRATRSSSAGRRRSSRSSPSWSPPTRTSAKGLDRRPGRSRQGRHGRRDPRPSAEDRADHASSAARGNPTDIDDLDIAQLADVARRSSSCRPIPTIRMRTSSRRCSRSPTTRSRRPEPYHIVAELRDGTQPRRRAAGRRRRGPADHGRRPHLADRRPDLSPGRACRSSTPTCSTSTATRSTSRTCPSWPDGRSVRRCWRSRIRRSSGSGRPAAGRT